MKKILCLIFFASFVLVGCGNDLEKNNTLNNTFDERKQNSIKSNEISELTYNMVINSNDRYEGMIISWTGTPRLHGLNTGSFYILDSEHKLENLNDYHWFWAIPNIKNEDAKKINDFKSWVETFEGVDDYKGGNIFLITGKILENDCGYYGKDVCIPDIDVIKIEELN